MDIMLILQIIVLFGGIYLGVKLGGMGVGYAGGLGVIILTLLLGMKTELSYIPIDVILIIASVISAITALQVAGGLDYLVQVASKILRKNPKQINFLAPIVTYFLTILAGTGHTAFSMIPVIVEVAKTQNIKPSAPLALSVVSSQVAITASPISAAFVAMTGVCEPLGVSYPILLFICISTTFVAMVVTAFIVNKFYDLDLSKDPIYQDRLAKGLVEEVKAAEYHEPKPYAKRSVVIFLVGVLVVVTYALCISKNVNIIKPNFIADYEKVYELKNPDKYAKLMAERQVILDKQDVLKKEGKTLSIDDQAHLKMLATGQEKGSDTKYISDPEKPKKELTLSRDTAIIGMMLTIGFLIVVLCKVDTGKLLSTNTFQSGMNACICVIGIAWLGTTFVNGHLDSIKEVAKHYVTNYPFILAVALYFLSCLLYSQAATTRVMMPAVAAALGMTSPENSGQIWILVASFAAVSGLFVLPTYPTTLGAIAMDDTGTTRVGKFVFNHSFFIPGTIMVALSVILGFIVAPVLI